MKTFNILFFSAVLLMSCRAVFADGADVSVSVSVGDQSNALITKKECKNLIKMEESTLSFLYGARLSKEADKKFVENAKYVCDEAISENLTVEETTQRLTTLLNTVTVQ